jgi:hypothetical protein
MTDPLDQDTPLPDLESPVEDPRTELAQRVGGALLVLPGFFEFGTRIEGIDATDLFSLNSVLGTSIEVQAVHTLNKMRTVWDPTRSGSATDLNGSPRPFQISGWSDEEQAKPISPWASNSRAATSCPKRAYPAFDFRLRPPPAQRST